MRKRTDRLYVRSLGPREREALSLIECRPGITPMDLAQELGVTLQRVWAILGRLEASRVRREQS
jgi:DNA-binding MarR family transcriptional regulator